MNKISDFINSKTADDDTLYKINLAISANTFVLIFIILDPMVISTMEKLFNLSPKTISTLTNIIIAILYYPANIAVALLAVTWQKKKLAIKSLKKATHSGMFLLSPSDRHRSGFSLAVCS